MNKTKLKIYSLLVISTLLFVMNVDFVYSQDANEPKIYAVSNSNGSIMKIINKDGKVILEVENEIRYTDEDGSEDEDKEYYFPNYKKVDILIDENYNEVALCEYIYNEINDLYERRNCKQVTIYDLDGNSLGIDYEIKNIDLIPDPRVYRDKLIFIASNNEVNAHTMYIYDFKNKNIKQIGDYSEYFIVKDIIVCISRGNGENNEKRSIKFLNLSSGKELVLYKYDVSSSIVKIKEKNYFKVYTNYRGDYRHICYNLIDEGFNIIYEDDILLDENEGLYEKLNEIYTNDYKKYRTKKKSNDKIIFNANTLENVFLIGNKPYYLYKSNNKYVLYDEKKKQISDFSDRPIYSLVRYPKASITENIFYTEEGDKKSYFILKNSKNIIIDFEDNDNYIYLDYGYIIEKDNDSFIVKKVNSNAEFRITETATDFKIIKCLDKDYLMYDNKGTIKVFDMRGNEINLEKGIIRADALNKYIVLLYGTHAKIYDKKFKHIKTIDKKYNSIRIYENNGRVIYCLFNGLSYNNIYDLFDDKFRLMIENSNMPYQRVTDARTGKMVYEYLRVCSDGEKDRIIDYNFNTLVEFRDAVANIYIFGRNGKKYYKAIYLSGKGSTYFDDKFKVLYDNSKDISFEEFYSYIGEEFNSDLSNNSVIYYSSSDEYPDGYHKLRKGYKKDKIEDRYIVKNASNEIITDKYDYIYNENIKYMSFINYHKECGIIDYNGNELYKFKIE